MITKPTYTVLCMNYTGAHFRGIDDETDGQICLLEITGSEEDVVDYLLEECSYGKPPNGAKMTMGRYISAMEDGSISNFDGCGGVFSIEQDGKVLLDLSDEFWNEEELVDHAYSFYIPADQDLRTGLSLNTRIALRLKMEN